MSRVTFGRSLTGKYCEDDITVIDENEGGIETGKLTAKIKEKSNGNDDQIIKDIGLNEERLNVLLQDLAEMQTNLPDLLNDTEMKLTTEKCIKREKRKSCFRRNSSKVTYFIDAPKTIDRDDHTAEDHIDEVIFDFYDWVDTALNPMDEIEKKRLTRTLRSFFDPRAILYSVPNTDRKKKRRKFKKQCDKNSKESSKPHKSLKNTIAGKIHILAFLGSQFKTST